MFYIFTCAPKLQKVIEIKVSSCLQLISLSANAKLCLVSFLQAALPANRHTWLHVAQQLWLWHLSKCQSCVSLIDGVMATLWPSHSFPKAELKRWLTLDNHIKRRAGPSAHTKMNFSFPTYRHRYKSLERYLDYTPGRNQVCTIFQTVQIIERMERKTAETWSLIHGVDILRAR